jgi:hypothetical protein
MIVTVTALDDEGVEDGVEGLDDEPEPLPLHPQAANTEIPTASIRDRMTAHYARQMPVRRARIRSTRTSPERQALTEAVQVYVFQVSRRYLAR